MSIRCTSFMLYKSLLMVLLISRLKDLQTCARQISSKCARFGHLWSPWSIKYCCWLYHLRIVASDNSSPSTQYYSDPSRLYLEDWFCKGSTSRNWLVLENPWLLQLLSIRGCRQSKKINLSILCFETRKA